MARDLSKFRQQLLAETNTRRRWHGAPPLQLREDLNIMAQLWAETLAKTGKFEHSPELTRNGAGENIAAHSEPIAGDVVVDMWYSEIAEYDFKNPGFNSNTGHFTQLVWKNCTYMGAGMSLEKGSDGMYTFVAHYWPHGNILGTFDTNVLPRTEKDQAAAGERASVGGTGPEPTPKSSKAKLEAEAEEGAKSGRETPAADENDELQKRLAKLRDETVIAHNAKRQIHGAAPLRLNETLNAMAEKWANHLSTSGQFLHSPEDHRHGAGENIAGHSRILAGQNLVDMWYKEVTAYDFQKPGFARNTGHFTQVVWKGTEEIGVAVSSQQGPHGMYVYVVNYQPHGNVIGRFETNVLPSATEVSTFGQRQATTWPQSEAKVETAVPQYPCVTSGVSWHDSFSKSTPSAPRALAKLREETLTAHNAKRELHQSPPLKLSEELNNIAQQWAEFLSELGQFLHSPDDLRKGAGENIAAHSKVLSGEKLVDMWYSEIKNYNYSKPGFANSSGHFTQVVWKGTTDLGVGMSPKHGPHGMYTYVAIYRPHGNIIGQFELNVQPPKE